MNMDLHECNVYAVNIYTGAYGPEGVRKISLKREIVDQNVNFKHIFFTRLLSLGTEMWQSWRTELWQIWTTEIYAVAMCRLSVYLGARGYF